MLTITQNHKLPVAAAQSALDPLMAKYAKDYGITFGPWAGAQSKVAGSVKGFTFTGTLSVSMTNATFTIDQDPPWYVPTSSVTGKIQRDLAGALNAAQATAAAAAQAPQFFSVPHALGVGPARNRIAPVLLQSLGSVGAVTWGNGTSQTVSAQITGTGWRIDVDVFAGSVDVTGAGITAGTMSSLRAALQVALNPPALVPTSASGWQQTGLRALAAAVGAAAAWLLYRKIVRP